MKVFCLAAALTLTATVVSAMPTVEWETLGNYIDADGKPHYTQRFVIDDTKGMVRLCFNQFARKMHAATQGATIGEIVPGYYYIESSQFGHGPVTIDVVTDAALRYSSYMPDGFHGVDKAGNTFPVKAVRHSISDHPDQYTLPGSDFSPSPEQLFILNETLAAGRPPRATDIVPSVKKVEVIADVPAYKLSENIVLRQIENPNPEFYRVIVTPDSTILEFTSNPSLRWAEATVNQLLNVPQTQSYVIEDWPDFGYRGLMVDISRNFLPLNDLQKVVQQMQAYKLNTLHLHLVDDEAWRLEIPGMPELTDVGARRGYTTDEADYLAQIFAGDGNPNSSQGSANGYITRREFVDFLRYCNSLGIRVIPEIESPGHARAAIKAMEHRYRATGDDTYRLIEDGDSSTYTSAQSFHDNVMNPALEGPYRFLNHVTTEIKKMYDEAGVPLPAIHIGGDEVAAGAWSGAPSVQRMMRRLNLTEQTQVHAEFVKRISRMLADKGITVNGWQEIGVGHNSDFDTLVAPTVGGLNFWTVTRSTRANEAATNGYPVIICNVDHFYLDQTYTRHPEERGLTWGGMVDELATLNGYPYSMGRIEPANRDKLIGISGHIFAETIRDLPQVQTYMFPKALGLFERAWNSDTTYADADFSRLVGDRILPSLSRRGVAVHLRQPGARYEGGVVTLNSPYPTGGYEIRYTVDGTNPTIRSPRYTVPIAVSDKEEERPAQICASLFLGGKAKSVPTILYIP